MSLVVVVFLACLNHSYLPDGVRVEPRAFEIAGYSFDSPAAHYQRIIEGDLSVWETRLTELEGLLVLDKAGALDEARALEGKVNYSAALIFLGRVKEAIEFLETLEAEGDKAYGVAANLGTAYELSGDNPRALKWITEAVRRDPESHGGTEWLHILLLETKIAGRTEVFPLDDRVDFRVPRDFRYRGVDYGPRDVLRAAVFQTSERANFVKPPNAIMANLLAKAGFVAARELSLMQAKEFFEISLLYDSTLGIAQTALVAAERLERAGHKRDANRLMWTVIAIGVGVVLALIVAGVLVARFARPALLSVRHRLSSADSSHSLRR